VCFSSLSAYQARTILSGLDSIDFKGMDLVGATLMFDYISLISKDLPVKGM
jgi:hypothetical protein